MQTTMMKLFLTAAVVVLCADPRVAGAQSAPTEADSKGDEDLRERRGRCAPLIATWRRATDAAARDRAYADLPQECRKLVTDAQSAPGPQSAPVDAAPAAPAALRVEHKAFVSGGLRIWGDDGESITLYGAEVGGNVSKYVAVSADFATGSEGDGPRVFAMRLGVRAYLLPGTVSPYLGGRVGLLVGGDDSIAVWNAGAGVEIALPPSGVLLDLGVGTMGVLNAFGEKVKGRIREVSLGVGKRF